MPTCCIVTFIGNRDRLYTVGAYCLVNRAMCDSSGRHVTRRRWAELSELSPLDRYVLFRIVYHGILWVVTEEDHVTYEIYKFC